MDRAAKARRDEEFAAFMAGSGPALMRTATLLTGNTDAAQELVQAALVKVYGSWERVRSESALAYARRALVNQRTDTWRRTRGERPFAEPPERPAVLAGDPVGDRDTIARLLTKLTEQQRRVIVLRYSCDLTEAATADELGISVSAVKSLTHRAMTTLRTQHVGDRGGSR